MGYFSQGSILLWHFCKIMSCVVFISCSHAARSPSFEYVKQQSYYSFLNRYYGHRYRHLSSKGKTQTGPIPRITPHWAIEPVFILLAGASASFASQLVFHPINQIQNVHYLQLETIDAANARASAGIEVHSHGWWKRYAHAYEKTFVLCREAALKNGGWRKWLFNGFLLNTVKSTPSTAAALIVFELVRRKFGEEVRINAIKHDGFEIVL